MMISTFILLLTILTWLYVVITAVTCYFNEMKNLDSTIVFGVMATLVLSYLYIIFRGTGL